MSKNLFRIQRTVHKLHKNTKCSVIYVRRLSLWSEENIVKSPYKDIKIPNCTLAEYVWQDLDRWPERTAAVCAMTGRGYTYEQVFKLSNAFAANLRLKFNISDGDTVAVMLPNIPDYPVVALGILEAGGVISSINPIYTAHEVHRQLLLSNAKLVITLPEQAKVVKDALELAKLDLKVIVIKINHNPIPEGTILFNELSEDVHVDKSCLKKVRRELSDICFLPYSSGTTGMPKGVELTNRNLIANCEQINEPAIAAHNDTTASHQDAIMAVLPFFHIYGATVIMFHKMSRGAKLVTLAKFNPLDYLNTLHKYRVNITFIASPIALLMATHPAASSKTYESLDIIVNGAAPLAASDIEKFLQVAQRKIDFRQGYGLTETSPTVSLGPRGSARYSTAGTAIPSTELRVVDEHMNALGPNQTGELLVRGPQVMRGYRENRAATADALVGGWFRTGDLAFIDDGGYVTIADRLKELIKVKGYQVPPAELEAVLREHPAVTDAAVIGVPHPITGEAPKAFVVLKQNETASTEDISAFVKERVAEFKRISDIVFIDSIPKSTAGKILRRELKEKYV